MSTTGRATSLQFEIIIHVPQRRAFEVFTEEFDRIKPRSYNLLDVDIAETVLEGRVGGSIHDRGIDGSVCRWARVLAFEPPERLVFSWDIDSRWRPEHGPARTSEVEVRFTKLDADTTRVELHHRHLDRHGDGWSGYGADLEAEAGWPTFLERYRVLAVAS
ncbi:ATPase [Pseudactinotalea sp. HY160]|uniref:SRPBCC family protein n=1 Tax=Pseudactinotalea sp. HY160 TaxID=2654490 RepID=UPI00128E904F|nr:SRPBCC family protein [Pseudactinotalea sp. HY160]MPV51255.1 ATPase [Pseudactinotalea sp. HY160]